MANEYDTLTSDEINANLNNSNAGYQHPYASGEAHFFDYAQTGVAKLYDGNGIEITTINSGLFDRNGLASQFSSGPQSRNYAITDFKTFNPYRHYILASQNTATVGTDTSFKINISGLLQQSTISFNIYSRSFRTIVSNQLS